MAIFGKRRDRMRYKQLVACLQVRTYSKVFWKRYKELGEDQGEKYIKQIERGEQRIQRQQDIMDAIAAKMDRYRNPWQVRT